MRPLLALLAALLLASGVRAQTVGGDYEVAGKKAVLAHVGAYKGDPQGGKPVIVLVLSAKPQTGAKPASDALFGEFGDAIVVRLLDDGKVYSADLLHAAFDLPNNTATIFGGMAVRDFKKADGQISGHLLSSGDARGQKWVVDIVFSAKVP